MVGFQSCRSSEADQRAKGREVELLLANERLAQERGLYAESRVEGDRRGWSEPRRTTYRGRRGQFECDDKGRCGNDDRRTPIRVDSDADPLQRKRRLICKDLVMASRRRKVDRSSTAGVLRHHARHCWQLWIDAPCFPAARPRR